MKFSRFVAFLFYLFAVSLTVGAQIRTDFDRNMNKPVEPFRIIGNIYYVGASDVTAFLITDPKGHILIDGCFEETVPMIEKNVAKLGFKLADIKILLNNHAHYDHAGGLATLKKKTGAKLFSVKEQADHLERGGRDDFSFGDRLTFSPVRVDKIIVDGYRVKLGRSKLKTYLTPGHTKGCTTWTMRVDDGGTKRNVIFLCSTSALNYNLVDNPKYPDHASDFERTFARLKKMKVDVFLGSHAQFFKMDKKLKQWKETPGENPFVDSKGYYDFIDRMEKAFRGKYQKQKAEKAGSAFLDLK